jgi:hypothetical protein
MLALPCFAADDSAVFPGAEWQAVDAAEAGFNQARLDALRAWLRTQRTTGSSSSRAGESSSSTVTSRA